MVVYFEVFSSRFQVDFINVIYFHILQEKQVTMPPFFKTELMRDFDANASKQVLLLQSMKKKWTMIITTWFQASVNHVKLAYLVYST